MVGEWECTRRCEQDRCRPPSTLALLVGGLGVLALHTLAGMGGVARGGLFDHAVYGVLMGGSACTVLARGAVVRAQRSAWLTMGAGLLCWCLGELYYTLFVEGPDAAGGSISPADALYLVFYPCCYVALVLLLGAHLRELRIGMWLDGLIGGLAAAAVGAALILPPILHGAHGNAASLGIALAYPIGDLLLLMFALGALGMTGWRPGRVWLLMAAAMLVQRGRGLRLSLPDRDRQLSTWGIGRSSCGRPPPCCWRSRRGRRGRGQRAGGWRAGGWCRCRRSRCSPRWGC